MKKFLKSDTFYMIAAILGIIGGIGLILSAVTDSNLPKFVYIIISVCEFTASFATICNCRKNK